MEKPKFKYEIQGEGDSYKTEYTTKSGPEFQTIMREIVEQLTDGKLSNRTIIIRKSDNK